MSHFINRSLVSFCALPFIAAAADSSRVPEALRPAANEELAFVLAAQGVQIYACKPSAKDPYAFAWAFVAPEATLTEGGSIIGRHYAGPTWSSASDYSSVKGAVRERHDGGTGNIPWLLLTGTSSPTPGKFANVSSIQRLSTRGGIEPTEACDAASVGKEARVPYTADYYFYRSK